MIADRLVTATDEAFRLAEGPSWDAPRDRLFWVDIQQGLVVSGALRSDGTIRELGRTRFPGTVGAVAPSVAGDLLVAAPDRILVHCADGTVRQGPIVIEQPEGRRLNDGKPDPAGLFLVLTAAQCEQYPLSGRLFTVRVEVPGLPQPLWSGAL